MQKIINGIAIFSGAVALGIVGLGGYVFIRKDAIIDNVKSKIMESVLPGGLGDLGGGALGGLDIPDMGNSMTPPSIGTLCLTAFGRSYTRSTIRISKW